MIALRIGFSLLELLVVLALVGLVSGLALTGLARSGAGGIEARTVQEIELALRSARVEAMRSGSGRSVWVSIDGVLELGDHRGHVRELEAGELRAVDGDGRSVQRLEVSFGSDGRTGERLWRLADARLDVQRAFDLGLLSPSPGSGGAELAELASRGGLSGRLWLVRFDPVSGAVRTDRVGGGQRR